MEQMGIASVKPFLLKSEPSQSKVGIAAIDIVWDPPSFLRVRM